MVEGIAEVLACGAIKYAAYDWLKGLKFSELIDAKERHFKKWQRGITADEESGLHHLLHDLTNTMFLYIYDKYGLGEDDRWCKHLERALDD